MTYAGYEEGWGRMYGRKTYYMLSQKGHIKVYLSRFAGNDISNVFVFLAG